MGAKGDGGSGESEGPSPEMVVGGGGESGRRSDFVLTRTGGGGLRSAGVCDYDITRRRMVPTPRGSDVAERII